MRILWAALCVALFACLYSFPVAADKVQFAAGVVCDTAEQALTVGSLYDELGPEKALTKVNEDAKDPHACLIAQFAFVVVNRGSIVRADGKDWNVAEVTVVAVMTPQGLQHVPPKNFFTLLLAEGSPA